ncbi:MAG: hypothetical protein MUF82_04065 [Bacteroidetes bacterium]|jgi:TolB protein|nr:hypothetical protein [Bacteroidota bacterium]
MKTVNAFVRITVTLFVITASLSSQDRFPTTRLTADGARNGFPSWSPDGKMIVYSFIETGNGKQAFGLRKVSLELGAVLPFTDFIGEHPQWSPDGRLIVFDSDSGAGMMLIDTAGGAPREIIPDSIRMHNGGLPCWSPTGSHIAFKDSGGALWVHSLNTGAMAKLLRKEGFIAIPGCWSRDGESVLIALMDRQTRLSTLWKVFLDQREHQQITGHRDSLYRYLALSPDGSLLVYAVMQERRLGFWIMPAEGGTSLPLALSDRYHNESPAWSPDGKWLAFASGRTGHGDIYVMDVDIKNIKAELKMLSR